MKAGAFGEFGGVVRRRFTSAGKVFTAGEEITAELAMTWAPTNRIGLARSEYVFWYQTPRGAEDFELPETVTVKMTDGTLVTGRFEPGENEPFMVVIDHPMTGGPVTTRRARNN